MLHPNTGRLSQSGAKVRRPDRRCGNRCVDRTCVFVKSGPAQWLVGEEIRIRVDRLILPTSWESESYRIFVDII